MFSSVVCYHYSDRIIIKVIWHWLSCCSPFCYCLKTQQYITTTGKYIQLCLLWDARPKPDCSCYCLPWGSWLCWRANSIETFQWLMDIMPSVAWVLLSFELICIIYNTPPAQIRNATKFYLFKPHVSISNPQASIHQYKKGLVKIQVRNMFSYDEYCCGHYTFTDE